MQHAASALTPAFMPFRPSEIGWVAYHDIAKCSGCSGCSGLAMTWRVLGEGLRWAAVYNRTNDGCVTASGRLQDRQDVAESIADAFRGGGSNRALTEGQVLALMFPHADNSPSGISIYNLPSLSDHANLARRAVAEADLIPSMRAAFKACLDHGSPRDIPISVLRRKTSSGEWPALTLAAQHPELVRAVLETQPALMAGDDPMAALRRRWPGMTEAHLRRLGKGRNTQDAFPLLSHPITTLNLLFAIPVNWWPKPADLHAFDVSALTLGAIASCCDPGVAYDPLFSSVKGDWPSFVDRLGKAAGLSTATVNNHFLVLAGRDCRDPVKSLIRDVIVPLIASQEDEGGMMRLEYAYEEDIARNVRGKHDPSLMAAAAAGPRLLYDGKSAPGILETSRIWHERQELMQANILGKGGDTEWPALFKGEYRNGAVGVVAIRDYAALREEGACEEDRDGVRGLKHCIASRLSECLSGQAHILSVRLHAEDGTWKRLSTCQVMLRLDMECPRILVDEHRGEGNSDAPHEAVIAVSLMAEAILQGRLGIEPDALDRNRDLGGSIARECGYDWRDPEELARAVLTWEPFLPRWARGLGPDGLYDALVEREILPAPSPSASTLPTFG